MLFRVKDENGLDSDRYLEMITAFVQSIPYEDHPGGAPPKFPVETVAERTGDCDDKSLLLAALLSRAGYDVALLNFIENSHMGVGIAADTGTYGSTGYAFIETTDYNFVGGRPVITWQPASGITRRPTCDQCVHNDSGALRQELRRPYIRP